MKTIAMITAAGSLAAITAPANAAEFETGASTFAPMTSSITLENVATYRDPPRHAPAFGYRSRSRDRYYDDRRYYDDDDRIYDRRGRYREPRRIRHRDRVWRGRDGRYYCERDNGTTGLVIGAGLGALLGRTIDTDGDRTVGTLLGGALGAVLGREIDRGSLRCR